MAITDNSEWMELANNILRQAGLPEILTADIFNATAAQGRRTRYQECAKEYIRHIHEMWSVDLPVEFARRRITLPVNSGTAIYALDTGINVESITFDSFRNLTQGIGSAGKLYNWTYEYFSKRYPDVSLIQSAAPTHYIFLPPDRTTDESPIYRVRIYPNPDRNYTLEYVAQLNAYSLTVATSKVLWPKTYNHVLERLSRAELEDILGEGKGSGVVMAMQAYQKMRQKASRPAAERKAIRMQKMFSRRRSYGYTASPADDDAPYSTPDTIR